MIDDDADARSLAASWLSKAGYAVATACDGISALRRLAADPEAAPWLIIVALDMEGMSGWEVVTIMRSEDALARVAVIVTSARAPNPLVLERGAVAGWLPKPLDEAALLALVRKLRATP